MSAAVAAPDVVGRYAVYGRIASGGTATVHVGRLLGAIGFSRIVAIKRLHPHLAEDPEFLSVMVDEARLASRIHHPNVVSTLDVVAEARELLLVMDYVRGESLARLLRLEIERGARVPPAIASAIVIGALHGLHAAHEAVDDRGTALGIVHRDVSPQNILVGADGVARVIDFGIAKAAGRLQTTREGVLKGKMAYMAPEQLEGLDATRRTDVYAMAVVLWETLVGQRLFRADNDAQLVVRILTGANATPPSREVPGLSPGLDAVVMRGLAPDPADRFASARDMAEALIRVVPPAFPTVVGAWVQDVARDRLELHGAMLAEIEASADVAGQPVPASGAEIADALRAAPSRRTPHDPMPFDPAPNDEEPPSMSQPTRSALSMSWAPPSMLSRVKLAAAIGLTALAMFAVGRIEWRASAAQRVAFGAAEASTIAASVGDVAQPVAPSPGASPPPAPPSPAAPSVASPPATRPAAPPTHANAGTRWRSKALPPPQSAPPSPPPPATAAIRFTQPD